MRKYHTTKSDGINAHTARSTETAPASGRNAIMNRNRGNTEGICFRRCLRPIGYCDKFKKGNPKRDKFN